MKSRNLLSSFKYAFTGIITTFKSERNLKIHTLATILVIILGFVLHISKVEWCLCILAIGLVIGAEIINTAIEETVNIASPNISEGARKAKDMAAGAVLIFAIASAIIGLIIFIPKILLLF